MKTKEEIRRLLRQGEDLLGYWDDFKRWKQEVGIFSSDGLTAIYNGIMDLEQQLEMIERFEQ